MSQEASPLLYVDTSEVRAGALDEVRGAVKELAQFIDDNEPRILSYNVYFDAGGRRMTVTHVHPDSESLEYHMEVAGPAFRRFTDLVDLQSIQVFGEPSERALRQLEEKAQSLGSGKVSVHGPHAGFSRLAPVA